MNLSDNCDAQADVGEPEFAEFLPNEYCQREIARGQCFVYIIQAGDNGPVKIGTARNPFARLRELQTGSFSRLRLIYTEDMGPRRTAARIEAALHRLFCPYRMIGEWFQCVGALAHSIDLCMWGHTLLEVLEETKASAHAAVGGKALQ